MRRFIKVNGYFTFIEIHESKCKFDTTIMVLELLEIYSCPYTYILTIVDLEKENTLKWNDHLTLMDIHISKYVCGHWCAHEGLKISSMSQIFILTTVGSLKWNESLQVKNENMLLEILVTLLVATLAFWEICQGELNHNGQSHFQMHFEHCKSIKVK